jgi:hypothetical protein
MRGEKALSLTDLRELCAHFSPDCALGREIHAIMAEFTLKNIRSRYTSDRITMDFAYY